MLPHLIFTLTLSAENYYRHFPDKETELHMEEATSARLFASK